MLNRRENIGEGNQGFPYDLMDDETEECNQPKPNRRLKAGKRGAQTAQGAEIIHLKEMTKPGPRRPMSRFKETAERYIPDPDRQAIRRRGRSVHTEYGLTPKQEQFALMVAEGKTLADAYRLSHNVGPDTAPKTIYRRSQELADKPAIAARINQEVERRERVAIHDNEATRKLLREFLQEMMLDPEKPPATRVKAAELLGKVGGVSLFQERPEQIKAKAQSKEQLEELEKRLAEIMSRYPSERKG